MTRLYVIGIGYKPLDKMAREIILKSKVILASNRLYEVFKGYDEFERVKDRIKVINNVDETIAFIKERISPTLQHSNTLTLHIVLLASGDPLFYGIGRRAVREFGKEMVEIIPELSSIQIAFARIKEAWDDAFLMSLHGGPDPEKRRRLPYELKDIPLLIQKHNKIAILTDKENNPLKIAKVLLEPSALLRYCSSALKIYVCERLGYPDERITEGSPQEIADMTFSEPNVVIIKESAEQSSRATEQQQNKENNKLLDKDKDYCSTALLRYCSKIGLTENEIIHSRGLITKDEVRAVTIHKLRLPQKGVFWDIGAGSGSVSIEAAKIFPELQVFAIEKDKEQINNIKENRDKFGIFNIEVIEGVAPDVLMDIPHPDRVFIGGSGSRLKGIMDFLATTPAKIIVINAATIETLNEAVQYFENNGFKAEISEVSVSRSKIIAGKKHMQALNPVFIITGER